MVNVPAVHVLFKKVEICCFWMCVGGGGGGGVVVVVGEGDGWGGGKLGGLRGGALPFPP